MNIRLHRNFTFFQDVINLERLNAVLKIHNKLSPNLIIGGTGCSFQEALQILILLFEMRLADGFILVYLKDIPDAFIGRNPLEHGFPKFPYSYNYGDDVIGSPDEVLYEFEFQTNIDDIRFMVNG